METITFVTEILLMATYLALAIGLYIFFIFITLLNKSKYSNKNINEDNTPTIKILNILVLFTFILAIARSFYFMFISDIISTAFLLIFYALFLISSFYIFNLTNKLSIMNIKSVKDNNNRDYVIYVYWLVYFFLNLFFIMNMPDSNLLVSQQLFSLFSQLFLGSTLILIAFLQINYSKNKFVFWLLLVAGLMLPIGVTINIAGYSIFSSNYLLVKLTDSLIKFIASVLFLTGMMKLTRLTYLKLDGYYKDHIGKKK